MLGLGWMEVPGIGFELKILREGRLSQSHFSTSGSLSQTGFPMIFKFFRCVNAVIFSRPLWLSVMFFLDFWQELYRLSGILLFPRSRRRKWMFLRRALGTRISWLLLRRNSVNAEFDFMASERATWTESQKGLDFGGGRTILFPERVSFWRRTSFSRPVISLIWFLERTTWINKCNQGFHT